MTKKIWFGILIVVFSIHCLSCASIQPMSNEAIRKYALASNPNDFRNFQYYVSRDIVLTYVSSEVQISAVGQININRDIIQILSSTPGVVIKVERNEYGHNMLGVAFEASDDDLLWFVQDPTKPGTFFYLVYTNEELNVINYGGNPYSVSYEQAGGMKATIQRMNQRLNPFSKVKKGEYNNMEPILLYEEKIRESGQRRNVQGRTL